MAVKIYLSPSNQSGNTYATGGTNEMVQCEKIANATASALKRCGFEVMVADSNESKLFVCTPDGTLVATYDLPEIENAESVCVDRKNDCVWVGSDEDSPKLYRLEFQF